MGRSCKREVVRSLRLLSRATVGRAQGLRVMAQASTHEGELWEWGRGPSCTHFRTPPFPADLSKPPANTSPTSQTLTSTAAPPPRHTHRASERSRRYTYGGSVEQLWGKTAAMLVQASVIAACFLFLVLYLIVLIDVTLGACGNAWRGSPLVAACWGRAGRR